MYPLAHVGVATGLGRLLLDQWGLSRLVLLPIGFGALLPDIVDKGPSILASVGGIPRIGHSLVFVVLLLLPLAFWGERDSTLGVRRMTGLVGLGAASHLLLDLPPGDELLWPFTSTPGKATPGGLDLETAIQGVVQSPPLLAGEVAGATILLTLLLEATVARSDEEPASAQSRFPTPGDGTSDPLTFSVVICTRGRDASVLRLLEALEDQTRAPDEILVVDGDPGGKLAALVEDDDGRIRYIPLPNENGLTEARNEAIDRIRGQICVFLDDDTVPEPDLIEEFARIYRERPEIGGAGGVPVEPSPPGPLRSLALRFFMWGPFENPPSLHQDSPDAPVKEVRRLGGAIQSYRREVFDQFRFDENLKGYCPGEDKDFSYRVSTNYPLLLVPSARAFHEVTGWASQDLAEKFEMKILSHSYHMFKNLRGSPPGTIAYLWLMVGIYCEALIETVVYRSFEPLKGLFRGLRWLVGGMDGAAGIIEEDPRLPTETKYDARSGLVAGTRDG